MREVSHTFGNVVEPLQVEAHERSYSVSGVFGLGRNCPIYIRPAPMTRNFHGDPVLASLEMYMLDGPL